MLGEGGKMMIWLMSEVRDEGRVAWTQSTINTRNAIKGPPFLPQ
jgi:hypothetical protein